MKWYWWLTLVAVILLIVYRKKATEVVMNTWNDIVTNQRIANLHPSIRERVKSFIQEAARQGVNLRITAGLRTFQEQQDLYDQGRSKPGKIVTNAKPGSSFHNYGLAIDVVEMKDGKGIWENPNWAKIGALGKQFGFEWGGDWTTLKDLPHFEYPPGMPVSTLQAAVESKKVDPQGYVLNIA